MQFSYIAGSEAEQYEFVRIPKTLISNDYFSDLSNPSRILYGLLFDRMSSSPKTAGWTQMVMCMSFTRCRNSQRIFICPRGRLRVAFWSWRRSD